MPHTFSPIPELLAELAAARMIILVNCEVDMLARYVARQLAVGSTHSEKKS